MGRHRLQHGRPYAGLRAAKIGVDMVQHALLPQAVLPLAEGGHPSPHSGDLLTDA